MRIIHLVAAATLAAGVAAPLARAAAISDTDRTFLRDDAQGAMYEKALAEQATKDAMHQDVKSYASQVVSDHDTYNQALDNLLKSKGVDVPKSMTGEDQSKLDSIGKLTGDAYDKQFVSEAVRINADDKSKSATEEASTSDPDIKAFLQKFASVDAKHEKEALALPE